VVGAGPAGLACANDLALEGHDVTVYEALPEPGGMLRYAIPEYRLPKEELKGEIDYIRRLGVEILCGVDVGGEKTAAVIRDACDALFVATGAPKGLPLGVEGETLEGIVDGIRFLRGVNRGEHASPGDRVAVIGGGNTAVDCARTAKRLGSASVTVVYRRTREEMPAAGEEIEALLHEGIGIEFLAAPVRFRGDGGKVAEMECVRMELGEPDESGRRRPVPKAGSEFTIPVDSVITALGQAVETSFLESLGVALGRGGTVTIDTATGATNIEGVFAGGDVVTGPAYVIDAIAAGRKAARSIGFYLRGEAPAGDEERGTPQRLSEEQRGVLTGRIEHRPRMAMPEEPVDERVTDFREVGLGYQSADAMAEARRCIAGQVEGCIGCGECLRRCEAKAIDYSMRDELVEMYFDGIVVAPGFDLYDPTEKTEFGYGRLKGVITGMEFERLTSVTGPTGGDIVMNGKTPKRFYFIQCVGSRDRQSGARFCSRVCCMYTAKHACIVKDRIRDARIYISYIDVRTYGKGYEEFYKSTQENGAMYIRGIPGEVTQGENGLLVRVEDMLSGELHEIEVDVVVLATGVRPRAGTGEMCEMMSLERDEYGFISTSVVEPSRTSVDGIFVCGMASGPRDVPDTVASGGEAASRCMEYVKESASS
ncbi:MAG TPA: FAD-dependent oxidoreductase, partial [Syntrophorhabdaceae bacterium]|nr:FAD-dependent oxidoreductase [Syntrophorhabdaceae bacterium]